MRQLSSKQLACVEALLSQPSYDKAAQAIGVTRQTVSRWMHNHRFRLAVFDAKKRSIAAAIRRIQALSATAVETLSEIMASKTERSSDRITASRALLELCFQHLPALKEEQDDTETTKTRIQWIDSDNWVGRDLDIQGAAAAERTNQEER